jgi:RNA polymerase sigma factor (sigma-70 family)
MSDGAVGPRPGAEELSAPVDAPDTEHVRSAGVAALTEWDVLNRALAALPELSRSAILLRHRDNLPFAQVGAVLGQSEASARRTWARAVDKLQQELQRHDRPSV